MAARNSTVVRSAADSAPCMDEALRRVRGADAPARIPAGKPRRLDPVSEAWQAGYRTLSPVRPNLAGPVLGAEVEQYLTGGAA